MRVERIGLATLYLGDCREIAPTLERPAAILTDPPFGIAYHSGWASSETWSENNIRGDASTEARDAALAVFPGVPALVFGSWRAPRPAETRAILIWDKGATVGMGALDIPWKPSAEEIYVLGKGWVGTRDEGAVVQHPPVLTKATMWNGEPGRQHPNEKPVGLLRRLLAKMPAGIVLDPFMGSGSTGVAAVEMRRPFVGIEIDERYFSIACRRIEQAQRQGDLLRDMEPAA